MPALLRRSDRHSRHWPDRSASLILPPAIGGRGVPGPRGLHPGIQPVFARKLPPVSVSLRAAKCAPAIGGGAARDHSKQDRSDNHVCCDLPGQRRNGLGVHTRLPPCRSGSAAMSRNNELRRGASRSISPSYRRAVKAHNTWPLLGGNTWVSALARQPGTDPHNVFRAP